MPQEGNSHDNESCDHRWLMVLGFGRIPREGRKSEGGFSAVTIGTKEFQVVRDEGLPNIVTEKPIGRHWRGHYGRLMEKTNPLLGVDVKSVIA